MVELRFSNPVSGLPATLVFGEREAAVPFSISAGATFAPLSKTVVEVRRTFALGAYTEVLPETKVRLEASLFGGATTAFSGAAVARAAFSVEATSEVEFFANVTARRTFTIEVGSDFTPVPMVRRYGQFDILSGANASFYGAAAVKATLNISGDSAFAPVGKFRKAYTMRPGVSYVFTPTKELFVLKTPSNRT